MRAIETRKFVHNRGGGRIAYVARDDCAAVAATVLMEGVHEGAVYDVTGPQANANELAALMASSAGKNRVVASTMWPFAGLVARGSGDDHARYGAELVASFGRAIREGYMASCTDTVARLTGRPERTLREVLEAKLTPAKR
jgi:NAD(P)H dehydrogenase (quinone)